jgi:hypothetical protein
MKWTRHEAGFGRNKNKIFEGKQHFEKPSARLTPCVK